MRRALLAWALAMSALAPGLVAADEGIVVIVVRHAEKATDDAGDPTLSEAGKARAEALAERLAQASLDVVFATQFRRTRDTAAPAARAAGVEVTVREVDAGNAGRHAADIARELRALPAGSTALVVGHSNTVPGLVAAIGGRPAAEMPETEYDRFTVIMLDGDDEARVVTSRY